MSEINLLADKIEQGISKIFAQASEQKSGMWNYALLFNQEKSKTWVIVLFFENKVQLKNSLSNGFCYSVHQVLKNELVLIDKELPISIRFDIGQYPSNETEYEQLLEKHTVTYDTLNNENVQREICSICGHDWGKHKLMGHGNPPQEGWMACPEEDCFCFLTWDLDQRVNKDKFGKLYKDET
ncbi:MAG: hypothetical protein IPJ81_11120 [Chitinophagaceae bacterium]|nr:hypothetical protein [Chitinophagaceae bacterium]